MKATSIIIGGISLTLATATWAATGKAVITGTAEGSKISGTVTFEDTKDGLTIVTRLSNMPPGEHGFHIHEFGDCGDMAKNAGSHYNPENNPHGHAIKDGISKAHAGDFGNIPIKADGTGRLEALIPGLSLTDGKYTVGGRAVVLHEKADDFGQPVGNAGGRIGCGPIIVTGK